MHNLEYILLVTSVAVQKGKIKKSELVNVLERLASVSHDYEPSPYKAGPYPDADASLDELGKEWSRRFDHLMRGN